MSKELLSIASDFILWVILVLTIGALTELGIVADQAIGLAGGALWLAIRASRKADVNTAHKNSEVQ
jgi:hypothetical protein